MFCFAALPSLSAWSDSRDLADIPSHSGLRKAFRSQIKRVAISPGGAARRNRSVESGHGEVDADKRSRVRADRRQVSFGQDARRVGCDWELCKFSRARRPHSSWESLPVRRARVLCLAAGLQEPQLNQPASCCCCQSWFENSAVCFYPDTENNALQPPRRAQKSTHAAGWTAMLSRTGTHFSGKARRTWVEIWQNLPVSTDIPDQQRLHSVPS